MMRAAPLLLAALTFWSAPHAASADSLSEEGAIFRDVCLTTAPALSEASVRSAVASVTYSKGDILTSAGVQFEPGRRCKVAFAVPGAPSDAEVRTLAAEFAARIGGTLRQKKSAIGGDIWYEVRAGREKFGIEGGRTGNAQYFTLARR